MNNVNDMKDSYKVKIDDKITIQSLEQTDVC